MKILMLHYIKVLIFISIFSSYSYAGVLGTSADVVTLGAAAKGWMSHRGKNKDNIHKMFYKVETMTTKYVLSQMNNKTKVEICSNLNEAAIDFLNSAEIDEGSFYKDFYYEAKKQYKSNSAFPVTHYLISDLKLYRSLWFNEKLKGLFLGAKIRNSDLQNLEFHPIDITKHELSNIFSLENSFYAGNYSEKNIKRYVLIKEAINLTGLKLLEEHCNDNKESLVFLKNNRYLGKWMKKDPLGKLAKTLPSYLIEKNKAKLGLSSKDNIMSEKVVELSADSYLPYELFKDKYKTDTNKIGTSEFNNVRFFAIEEEDIVYITFRGTASKSNAKTDLNFRHVNFMEKKDVKVHAGFYNIAKHAKQILRNLIKKEKPIIITGHSLGGAVGLLLGGLIHSENINKNVTVFTFGMPPVGNENFVNSIKGLKHYRYAHKNDLITGIHQERIDNYKEKVDMASKYLNAGALKVAKAGMKAVTKIQYNLVHHGNLITLNNPAVPSKSLNQKVAFVKKIIKKSDFHNIKTYVHGIKSMYKSKK